MQGVDSVRENDTSIVFGVVERLNLIEYIAYPEHRTNELFKGSEEHPHHNGPICKVNFLSESGAKQP